MNKNRLVNVLTGLVEKKLAERLVDHFIRVRHDCATKTLERVSPGKFVEVFVQCLQWMSSERYEDQPNVDNYLKVKIENEKEIPESLRLCGSRIARAIYTMRNKRNIAHQGDVSSNTVDLQFIYQGAAWIMAEMVRCSSDIAMEEAGAIIRLLQVPVGTLVEEINGTRLVHAKVSVRVEILILLHSHYPDPVPTSDILKSLQNRRARSVKNRLVELRNEKFVFGDNKTGYTLTSTGYAVAIEQIERIDIDSWNQPATN